MIGTPNDIRGGHKWLDGKEDVRDCIVGQRSLELTKFFCVGVFPGS